MMTVGYDLTESADEFLRLLLGAGRIGVLVFFLTKAKHRQVRQALEGGQIVFDEIYGDVLSGKDTAEGSIYRQFRGRANAGHHRRGHITEEQHRIFLLGC